MEKEVTYPGHVLAGIGKNHRAYPLPANLRIFGADTETVHGNPHTVQVWDGADGEGVFLSYVDKASILPTFWGYCLPRCRKGGVNLCYFHNLHFDLMILFAAHALEMYEQVNAITFFLEEDARPLKKKVSEDPARRVVKADILFGKVNAATLALGKHYMEKGELRFDVEVELKIYDSRAFTLAGLDRSLKMFQIPQPKLAKPDGLGDKPLRTPYFEAYAKQDVTAEWHLARKILDIHDRYKVRPSISLPQFVSRVFRHDFFRPKDRIEFPPLDVARAGELSYHGGKNGYYHDGPAVFDDVTEVDINSAFPWAMRELPSFLKGEYKRVDAWAGPDLVGVYCLSGESDPKARYPLVFDHSFKRVDGSFEDLWQTSYETEKIRSAPFVKLKKCWGYVWVPGRSDGNPFRDYVDHFYKLKEETPRDDPYYNFYKIALNALYGKLVGVVDVHDLIRLVEGDAHLIREEYKWDEAMKTYVKARVDHRAGQMYHPFIASLITGRVRALLYDLETKYEAIHSATDSIKTLKRVKSKPGLGGWKEECFGRCYIFRNKLYLHFDKNAPAEKAKKGIVEDGQALTKYALHAYKGDVADLYKNRKALLREGKMTYSYTRPVGLREGLKQGMTPGDFVTRTETMELRRKR